MRSLFILPGFLLYYVLVIAASSESYFNWSNPVNIPNLLYHMSGGDFSHLLSSASGVFSKNIKLFVENYIHEFAVISGVLCFAGFVILYRRNKILFIFFFLLILSCSAFAFYYNVRDVLNYFTLLNISLSILFSLSILELMKFVKFRMKRQTIPVFYMIIFGVIIVTMGFYYNYNSNNNSRNYVIEDFTLNSMENIACKKEVMNK